MLKKTIYSFTLISLIIILAGCGGGVSVGNNSSATGSVALEWNIPTSYVDGTPTLGPVGFKVYYGTSSRSYTNTVDVKEATRCIIGSLSPGNYYFAITAYDTSGIESDFSAELRTTI